MDVRMFTVGPVAENTYIFRRDGSERALIVDPGDEAELIGLAPRAAFDGFPDDVPLHGFSPERHILEEALAALH